MKTIKIISFIFLIAIMSISCTGQNSKNENISVKNADDVHVFYFHYTRRCSTCEAVEAESKNAVAELYGDKVSFAGYNLDEEDGQAKGDELEVSGQTLLIVYGNTKINLTNEGFMYATTAPEKLKAIIKEKVDPLLN